MDRKYIQSVKPLTDHVLQVDFISGSDNIIYADDAGSSQDIIDG